MERSAARTLINDLSRKLEQWTGRRWTVIVSNEAGQPTVRSQNEVVKNQRERAAEADPRVQEVLARFPGTKVVEVRKLAPEPPESDASGDVYKRQGMQRSSVVGADSRTRVAHIPTDGALGTGTRPGHKRLPQCLHCAVPLRRVERDWAASSASGRGA